jgi:ferritin
MIKKKVLDAINKQINAEMYSAYLYLSMSAYFEDTNLSGCANWMKVQAQEEMTHAMKFYNFVVERGGSIKLDTIKAPEKSWKSPLHVFEEAYKHEVLVTSLINKLVKLAEDEGDYATEGMLQWFVDEQVEEESNADEIVNKLKLAKGAGSALFMIDKELSARIFVDETVTPKQGGK